MANGEHGRQDRSVAGRSAGRAAGALASLSAGAQVWVTAGALAGALGGALALAAPAAAQSVRYETDAPFEDVAFALEQAIIGRGLVVDHVSHVGEMLERTREDVGSDVTLFDAADVYMFCSAALSREMMEADRANIVHCPYSVYIASAGPDGPTEVGYRVYPEGPMQKVQAALDAIAREAAGLD